VRSTRTRFRQFCFIKPIISGVIPVLDRTEMGFGPKVVVPE